MAEAKEGQEFIQHEFDEAIVIQRAIIEAERTLAEAHPLPEAKTAIGKLMKTDEKSLEQLTKLGERFGATGKAEEVAGAFQQLSTTVTKSAQAAPSEAYEAHAVLLNMLRKQQDSAGAMAKIAQEMGDREVKDAATEMQKTSKAGAEELSTLLSQLAVQIATGNEPAGASR
jgi:thioredoxin-like negative regulator of GroEL